MESFENLPQQSKQLVIKKQKKNTPFQEYINRKDQKKKTGTSLSKLNL